MPIPPSPFVTFIFTGLVAIGFGNNNEYGQVGFQSTAHGHEVKIVINKKLNQTVIGTVANLKFTQETIRNMPNIWVDIEGGVPSTQQRIEKFFSSSAGSPPTDPRDFRYIIDLEDQPFYNRPLTLNSDIFKPGIFFAKGLFYTAALSERPFITTCENTSESRSLLPACLGINIGKVAEYIGVNLYTEHPDQMVVLRSGKEGSEMFRLTPEAGVTYEILVGNNPTPDMIMGGHFLFYYDAISLEPGTPQISLMSLGPDVNYNPYLCSPVCLGISGTVGCKK